MAIKPTNTYFTDFEDNGLFSGEGSLIADMFVDIVPELAPMTTAAVTAASQPTPVATPVVQAPANPTIDNLIQAYQQQGATTTAATNETDAGTQYNTTPNDLGGGWMAWEKPAEITGYQGQGEDATPITAKAELGGFSRKEGDYVNFYDLSGNLVDRQKWNESALTSAWNDLGPVAMAALTMGGGAGMLGNALFGLEGAAAAAAGGALGGGVNAAITDQNILQGALRGGLSSGLSEYLKPVSSAADADLAGGLIPEYGTNTAYDQFMSSAMTPEASTAIADLINAQQPTVTVAPVVEAPPAYYTPQITTPSPVDYSLSNTTAVAPETNMGGAQGLQPGTAANLADMGGGQGLTINLGAPSETLADALSTFGGVNPANLSSMGGAQGLTYQTPTGLVTETATLPTGIPNVLDRILSEGGINTATNIGSGIGTELANINTNVPTLESVTPTTPVTPESKSLLDSLTPSQAASLLKGALGLFGALSAGKTLSGGGSTAPSVGALPTQGIPLNSQDYFNAIQQNYNTLLPTLPRDVATPLSQWYNTQYTGT
jgi:hypothetical protein